VRFEVLTTISTEMAVILDVAPCGLVNLDKRFRGAYSLLFMENFAFRMACYSQDCGHVGSSSKEAVFSVRHHIHTSFANYLIIRASSSEMQRSRCKPDHLPPSVIAMVK
jgi:hypothetical protein